MATPNHAPGSFCWFECGSTDSASARSFYTQLFAWDAVDVPMPGPGGTYTLFSSSGEDIAGLYRLVGPQFKDVPSHWMTYVAVADVDETAKRARALGAQMLAEPTDVPGVGRMAVLRDPTGAAIAIAHFDQHAGTSTKGPFGWSELATRDTARASAFYTELFGWTAKADPKNPYTEFQVGERSIAGMMPMTPHHGEAPAHWMPYVMVDDCDACAAKAKMLGAAIYVPPTDIENVGRFAVIADPTGAALAFIKLLHH